METVMNTNEGTTEVIITVKPQGTQAEAAKLAVEAAILKDSTEAITILKRTIKDDVRNATRTSKGIFEAIVLAGDFSEVKGIFAKAEQQLVEDFRKENAEIKTFADIGKISGTGTLSYTNIKNTMLKAINEAEELCKQLQAYYDFQYECMTKAEQAEHAHKYVEEGFLNPWHSRYAKRTADDEHGSTKFNRDRKEANEAKGLHDSLKRERDRAKAKADEAAAQRLQEAAKRAGTVADNAPAGSGQTAQGMAGATAGRIHTGGRTLSVVLQREYSLLSNAIFSASDKLPDAAIIPILTRCTDALRALEGQPEQTVLEPGEVKPSETAGEDDEGMSALTDLDKAILEEFEQNEAGNSVEPTGTV